MFAVLRDRAACLAHVVPLVQVCCAELFERLFQLLTKQSILFHKRFNAIVYKFFTRFLCLESAELNFTLRTVQLLINAPFVVTLRLCYARLIVAVEWALDFISDASDCMLL
jgi:hypothetical protein